MPTSITLSKTEVELNPWDTETITATVLPEEAAKFYPVSWKSSDTTVVTVSGGVITYVWAWSATITVTAWDKSATVAVTCAAPGPEPIPETVEWWRTYCKWWFQNSEIYTLMTEESREETIAIIDTQPSVEPMFVLYAKALNDWYTFDEFVEEKWLTVDETWTSAWLIAKLSEVAAVYIIMWWLVDVKFFWLDEQWMPINMNAIMWAEWYQTELATRYAN